MSFRLGLLCEKLCDQCFRHEVVGARLWSDGMFAECESNIENDYNNSVQGKHLNTKQAETTSYILK